MTEIAFKKAVTFSVAALTSCALLWGVPGESRAGSLPNGDTIWTFASDGYTGSIVWTPGNGVGTMSLTSRSTGLTIAGTASPVAYVVDGPHGSDDTLTSEAFFSASDFYPFLGYGGGSASGLGPYVDLVLVDHDGVAFDGMTSAPVNPPPLSSFESAALVFRGVYLPVGPGGSSVLVTITDNLTALPEPSLVWLALAPLLVTVRRKRSPQA